VSYAVGYHFATFIPITLLGLWSLSRAHLHLAELRGADVQGADEGQGVRDQGSGVRDQESGVRGKDPGP
jgi:hypothetical protein